MKANFKRIAFFFFLIAGILISTNSNISYGLKSKTEYYDLAVVGCHSSGFAAGVTAARHGLRVALICKEKIAGGMLTAGQIGFVDGSPLFSWYELPGSELNNLNGEIMKDRSSWSLTGGIWKEFRERLAAKNLELTERFEPSQAIKVVNRMISEEKKLKVFYESYPTAVNKKTDHDGNTTISSIQVGGKWEGKIVASYWIDGSDTGELISLAKLPYHMGNEAGGGGLGDQAVMDYSYRWTAVENSSGYYPTTPPKYYEVNVKDYQAAAKERWNPYKQAMGITDDQNYEVHPLRLFNNQGRLTGSSKDNVGNPVNHASPGGIPDKSPVQKWDVNGGMNSAGSLAIAKMLRTNAEVVEVFRRNNIAFPYGQVIDHKWTNISFIQDTVLLNSKDKDMLVSEIQSAVKFRALGFLWFIRSGDLERALKSFPGGKNIKVRSDWSISIENKNQPDGMPELMYQREGRRIVSEYFETIYDLCPTYDKDVLTDRVCHSDPLQLKDSIAISDYPMDIHGTNGLPPKSFVLPKPHQLSFRTTIPVKTSGLLVGSALGVDREAFGSFRTEPFRLAVGGALGEAVVLAMESKTLNFSKINITQLQLRLAENAQDSIYYPYRDWNQQEKAWTNAGTAKAIQKLLIVGWISMNDLTGDLNPNNALTGTRGKKLALLLKKHQDAPSQLPWYQFGGDLRKTTLSQFGSNSKSNETAKVSDAYLWLEKKIKLK
ncbi:FAD dependent oxidoreductase [Paenibacillus sp. UNC496MF]|uniref:FAD-dependent oxidoreductase n=1 Tax=Paenibacillus sp. UNC496MF TaxID=1502753 RepID=UPI0008EC859E|nr:FAD-dependent oxidoreductase [Paenibacillus sp. UNC496MF]SFI88557.1 FAD dependent oxidoreductase [Paenibacillus sp. UNC496MF]